MVMKMMVMMMMMVVSVMVMMLMLMITHHSTQLIARPAGIIYQYDGEHFYAFLCFFCDLVVLGI